MNKHKKILVFLISLIPIAFMGAFLGISLNQSEIVLNNTDGLFSLILTGVTLLMILTNTYLLSKIGDEP